MINGISTASLYPLKTEESLLFLCEENVPVTEIFFNSHEELKPDFVKMLKHTAESFGTKINSVHPCGSVGEPYFLFSEYDRRTDEALDFYKRYYEAAAMLGGTMLPAFMTCPHKRSSSYNNVCTKLNCTNYCNYKKYMLR